MFGYMTAATKTLSTEERARYRAVYCGLCHALRCRYGGVGQRVLSYDMVFIALLLSSLYGMDEQNDAKRCAFHPLSKGDFTINAAVEYAADMNVILAYYQALDDWNDDQNTRALRLYQSLSEPYERASNRRKWQASMIMDCLQRLSLMEAANELNPDLPAQCFGELMGSVFAYTEDTWADQLRQMGAALGRFIYLLDACNDLRADLRKERYNPLVAMMGMDFLPMLKTELNECVGVFETLPLTRDASILRNVLYSGVWSRYKRT